MLRASFYIVSLCSMPFGCGHLQVTMLGASSHIVSVCTMLWLLPSPSDNAQSKLLYCGGMYQALAVVIAQ